MRVTLLDTGAGLRTTGRGLTRSRRTLGAETFIAHRVPRLEITPELRQLVIIAPLAQQLIGPRWRAPRDDHRRYGFKESAPEHEVITDRTDVRTRIPLVVPRGTTPASARQLRRIATQNSTSIAARQLSIRAVSVRRQ